MSVAVRLPEVHPMFTQACPLCGQENRIVARGTYEWNGKVNIHPDIGYSYCTCKAIFYTKRENLRYIGDESFNQFEKPLEKMKEILNELNPGDQVDTRMPDPFFIDWPNPEGFKHFNPRENFILWDLDVLREELENVGFEILKAEHEFDVHAEHPMTMHFIFRKPMICGF